MRKLAHRNLPLPGDFGTVLLEGRCGVVLERFSGQLLSDVIRAHSNLQALAGEFVDFPKQPLFG